MTEPIRIRHADHHDCAGLRTLQALSLRRLAAPFYDRDVIEAFIAAGTVPEELLPDRSYFVAEQGGMLVGCGGWTPRVPRYAGTAAAGEEAGVPTVRAVYVHPDLARRGIGRDVMAHVEAEIRRAGYRRAALVATLSGLPLYRRIGYREGAPVSVPLPGGRSLAAVRMTRCLAGMEGADADRRAA